MKSERRKGKCGGSIPPMVQDSESRRGLEGKETYHRGVKKLCSNVGFLEQRCIVRKEEPSPNCQLGFVFGTEP